MNALPSRSKIIAFIAAAPEMGRPAKSVRNHFKLSKEWKRDLQSLLHKMVLAGDLLREGRRFRVTRLPTDGNEKNAKTQPKRSVSSKGDKKFHLKGRIDSSGSRMWFVPHSPGKKEKTGGRRTTRRYRIPQAHLNGAKRGDLVLAEVASDRSGAGFARVTALLSQTIPFDEFRESFRKQSRLPSRFPESVLREMGTVSFEPEARRGRVDLREENVVTIDPASAKDHDDALSLRRIGKGWELGVHIADVTHFVQSGGAIDKEAIRRSFTQYLPWTSYPMLPPTLSEQWCSLVEGEDRFTLSCFIRVSATGSIRSFRFAPAVIRVGAFYSYDQAHALYQKGDHFLESLHQFTQLVRERRIRDGFLDFDMNDAVIQFNEDGEPFDVTPGKRLPSHLWIEECMLLANRCCARFMLEQKLPGMYRIHAQPDEMQFRMLLEDLPPSHSRRVSRKAIKKAIGARGYLNPALQKMLAQLLSGTPPLSPGLQKRILKSLKKAEYSPQCLGHFALGWKEYAHFTSPIRRYPDLWNHRLIKQEVAKPHQKWSSDRFALAEEISGTTSQKEIEVMKTERLGMRSAMAWIMRSRVGEEFRAEISGVEGFGLFVAVKNPMVEGLIPLNRLRDDYYEYDPRKQMLVGRRTGKRFRLGESLQVRCERVDPMQGQIDFEPVRRR